MRFRKGIRSGLVPVAALALAGALVLGACGDGEDRPGQVTSESNPSGSGSGSGSGTGSASGAGAASGSASGTGHGGHGSSAQAAFAESEADTVAEVAMTDYAFALPATVKGRKVFFEVANNGAAEHEFLVLDSAGKELGEIEPFKKADGQKELALELAPGTYTVVCLVEEGAKTHRELGMEASFTVE